MSSERLRQMSDAEMATALGGATPAWPPTPSLVTAVAGQINDAERSDHPVRPRLSIPSRRRTVLIVLAVLLALATAAVAAKLVIDIGAETIRSAPGTPAPLPVVSERAFGDAVDTVSHAEATAGFEVAVPSVLGPPDHVWVGTASLEGEGQANPQVTLAWDPRPGLPAIRELPWGAVLMEFSGNAERVIKTVFSQADTFQRVAFDGGDAYWVTGTHTITIENPQGNGTVDLRVTGNVFIWQHGNRTFRLETSLGLDQVRSIADPIR